MGDEWLQWARQLDAVMAQFAQKKQGRQGVVRVFFLLFTGERTNTSSGEVRYLMA
jgi:hypothetical protein